MAAAVRLCSVLLRCRSGGVCVASGHGKLPAPDMRNYSALRAEVIQIHHRTVPPNNFTCATPAARPADDYSARARPSLSDCARCMRRLPPCANDDVRTVAGRPGPAARIGISPGWPSPSRVEETGRRAPRAQQAGPMQG